MGDEGVGRVRGGSEGLTGDELTRSVSRERLKSLTLPI